MKGATIGDARTATYELAIAIDAPPDRVWEALTEETNAWWLPDFHMTGPGSVVTFDVSAGGHLVERHPDGGELLWFTVQWVRPAHRTLSLVGHIATDWGGPATSMLHLVVEEATDGGSVLRVTDAHAGHVDDANVRSLQEGWTLLFSGGLKRLVEEGVRHDGG